MANSLARIPSPSSPVVRTLPHVAERPCARPGCRTPAQATMWFAYATRSATLDRLSDEPDPQAYDLCVAHAGRTRPPQGWDLIDRRPEVERVPAEPTVVVRDLGGDATVAVLAAALRAVPDVPVPSSDREFDVTDAEPSTVAGTPVDAVDTAPEGEGAWNTWVGEPTQPLLIVPEGPREAASHTADAEGAADAPTVLVVETPAVAEAVEEHPEPAPVRTPRAVLATRRR